MNYLFYLFLVLSLSSNLYSKDKYYKIKESERIQLNNFYENCNGENWGFDYWPLPEGEVYVAASDVYPLHDGLKFHTAIVFEDENKIVYEASVEYFTIFANKAIIGELPPLKLDKVREFNLTETNLTGELNLELPEATLVYIYGNKFNAVNQNTSMPSVKNLMIDHNKFTFKELEFFKTILEGFAYQGQDTTLPLVYNASERKLIVLTEGENNQYNWYKGNYFLKTTEENFIILDNEDGDVYYCEVTNSLFYGTGAYSGFPNIEYYTNELDLSYLTGIENSEIVFDNSLFPNPTSDRINIAYHEKEQIKSIKIVNYLGINIDNYCYSTTQDGILTVNVSAIEKGIYFVNINNSKIYKFIKI